MSIAFARPIVLLLLPLCGAVLWLSARGSFAALSGWRARVAWAMRVVLIAAIIFALAGIQIVRAPSGMVVAFALDVSGSVAPKSRAEALRFIKDANSRARGGDRAALVTFAREALLDSEALPRGREVRPTTHPESTHTDLAGAVRLALGVIPGDAPGRVVLLTDGNENTGSVDEELLRAQSRGIPVDVVALATRAADDAVVREVTAPARVRRGEEFQVNVALESTCPQDAIVTITADDRPVKRQSATLGCGSASLQIPLSLAGPGFHRIGALVEGRKDTVRGNNAATAFVRVADRPRILLLDSDPSAVSDLGRALRGQDIVVDVGGVTALPTNLGELESYDAVLLCDFPAYAMGAQQMVMLRDAVRDLGIGLGMIGGEFSFGPGGYYQTPVEEALPVTMDISKHRAFPASAVVIVVDRSGSMGMIEDGVEKIQLAGEGACAVVDLLQPIDQIAVIAVDTEPTLVCPLRRASNKASVKSDARSLRAGGGGIYCYTGLKAAHHLLRSSKAAIRHVILLADGNDSEQQEGAVDLAHRMLAEGITTTAIAIGSGTDLAFLQSVAKAGKGQYYLTEYAHDLKKIFTRETLTVAKSALVEEQFRPRLRDRSEITAGIAWPSAPPLLGYVATSAKSLATVPLLSHKEDPILAHWQYGLGRTVAFTSDARPHWAAHWLSWPAYPKLWAQVARWCLRSQSPGIFRPTVRPQGDSAAIVAEATSDEGVLLNGLDVKARAVLPDGTRRELALDQTGPGRYEGAVPTPAIGSYVVSLSSSAGGAPVHQTFGFAVDYPPDLADTHANPDLLARVASDTGGRLLRDPALTFAPPPNAPRSRRDAWRLMLWLAALLLPLDVAVRRLVVDRQDLARIAAPVLAVLAFRRRRHAAPEHTATMERLLQRRDAGQPTAAPAPLPPPDSQAPPPTPPVAPSPPPQPPPPRAEEGESTTVSRLLDRKRRPPPN